MVDKKDWVTISQAVEDFLNITQMSRSENTARSYQNALNNFLDILEEKNIQPDEIPISELNESAVSWMLSELKQYAPATEQLYTVAVTRFFQYLMAEELADINLQRMQLIVRTRSRKAGQRLPQFPKEDIDAVIEYAGEFPRYNYDSISDRLIAFRDSLLIITLADTGLRVHEICNLRRGDIDWNEYKAIIIGKGDKQAVVRFSTRSIQAMKSYLEIRSELDGGSGRPLSSLPILARHDRGAGSKVIPITPTTARNIIKNRVKEVLGEDAARVITPHSFRHYFVTNVLKGSGGNLKLAQELARHKNIQVTQRYAHLSDDELDRGYYEIFED
ncbi:MAG: tyrosine-type recombinase/integrase [Aliifodinibius sp.]|nr:tyrosine-type recombinase/integrase [Fodinibius sp.]